jgi:hypothetical protein
VGGSYPPPSSERAASSQVVGESEAAQAAWSKPLASLLVEIKEAVAAALAAAQGRLGEEAKGSYLCRYDRPVRWADKLNSRPPAGEGGDASRGSGSR